MGDEHTVGINPSEFSAAPQPLDTNNKNLLSSIADTPFDEFMVKYLHPPATPDSYLDIRYAPAVWLRASEMVSRSHLFLYAFCLASSDESLTELASVREQAIQQCFDEGNEYALLQIDTKSDYRIAMASAGRRIKFPAWSWEMKAKMAGLSSSYGVTSRVLLIIYSCKALLNSQAPLGKLRNVLEKEVENWDRYVVSEKYEKKRFFVPS